MADITEQAAKFGDSDNTLLLKAASALQELTGGSGGAFAGLTDTQLRATPVPVTPGGGTARTLTSSAVTSNGTVTAGAKSVCFTTSSDWSGSVNGAARAVSQTFFVSVINPADTLPAIAYVRSAGTLYIDVMT